MPALHIGVASSASEMERLAPLWNDLLQTRAHTLFQNFGWNRLAAEVFRDRCTPHVVWAENESGAAIIPAAINHQAGRLELLGEALFDYRDVLCAGDREVLRLAWHRLAECGNPLQIISVRDTQFWGDFPLVPFAQAPQVDRALFDEQAFRPMHSRLGSQMRRLQRFGLSLRKYSGKASAIVRHLYECKRSDFGDSCNLFRDLRRREFMIAAAALEESRCEVFTLENDAGRLAAGLVTFRDGDTCRCYTIYFHPEWARYSPGVALLYEVTARSLAQGMSCDYMTGDYPYKLRLANSSRPLYKVELSAAELADMGAQAASNAA